MEDPKFYINQRLSYTPGQPYTAARCTVRYIGPVEGTTGTWLGVEWDVPGKGKHSGTHGGVEYFTCKSPNNALFIRPTRRPDETLSFLEGLKKKYTVSTDDPDADAVPLTLTANKVFEEVGFEKIQIKLGQLAELKIVILDGLCLDRANGREEIQGTCPKIEELDLSRNLFEHLQTVADICAALPKLRSLKISGNRFASLDVKRTEGQPSPFENVTALEISNTYLSWEEITQILSHFPHIHTLESSLNLYASIPPSTILPPTLHILNLERNSFTTLTSLLPLTSLPNLTHLILAHNAIVLSPSETSTMPPFKELTHLDLTFNSIATFPSLDAMPPLFPKLESLRLAHNPFSESLPREEAHMLTVARTPAGVRMLNHSKVTPQERVNAELYYLGRVAKELAAVAESEEEGILASHARWEVLCELHGAPRIDRALALEKRCLGSRLVEVEFMVDGKSVVRRVPRGVGVGVVRALVARGWGRAPEGVRLVLEEGGVEGIEGEMEDTREVGYYVEGGRGKVLVEV